MIDPVEDLPPPGNDPADLVPADLGDDSGAGAGAGAGGAAAPGRNPFDQLRTYLEKIDQIVDPQVRALIGASEDLLGPTWRRVSEAEPRWPMSIGVLAAIAMQFTLPSHLAPHPRWLYPALAAALLGALVISNPRSLDRESVGVRTLTRIVVAVISLSNAYSALRLVAGLVNGTEGDSAGLLLLHGGAIWFTNVIVFTLWYWQLDRGGPVARTHGTQPHADFLFPQMQSPELAPAGWGPGFVDYLYLSFTNATAFSPTDVLPLTRWAKLTMMLQSAVSLLTVVLVISRAVNILK